MAASKETSNRFSDRSGDSAGKRWRRWLVGSVVVIAFAMAALVFWRLPIAGMVLRAGLDWAGFPNARLTVSNLSLSRLRLTGVRLGGEVEAASAEIGFDLIRLPGPAVTRVSLGRTRIDLTDPAGLLRRRLDAPRVAQPATTIRRLLDRAAALPQITIEDVALRYPADGSVVSLSGSVVTNRTAARDYHARYALQLTGNIGSTAPAVSINGTARIGRALSSIDAGLTADEDAASGSLTLRAELSETDARISGAARINVADAGRLATLFAAFQGAAGRLSLSVRSLTAVVVALDAPLDRAGLDTALRRAGAGGLAVEASLEEARHPVGVTAVNATLSAVARSPDTAVDALRVDGRLALRAGRIRAGGIELANLTFKAPFRIDQRDDIVIIALPEPVRASATELKANEGGIVVSPVALSLSGGQTHALRFNFGTGYQADLQLELETDAATFRSRKETAYRVDIAPIALRLAGTAKQIDEMRLHLRAPRLSATERDREFIIDDLGITVQRVGNSHTGDLRGRLSVLNRGKPLIAPIEVQSGVSLWRDVLTFDGRAEAPGAVVLVTKGRHDLFAGRGSAELKLQPVHFPAGQVEFRSLVPGLSDIDIRAGTVGGEARLSWDKNGLDGDVAARIDGMNIAHRTGTTIEGLSATIRLDRIRPPHTPPGQIVRIRRIAAGAVLDDLTFRFALIDGATAGSTALKLDALTVGLAGGTLTMPPTVLGSSAETNQATVDLANVDLGRLLDLIGIDGVSGTGRLSGSIPMRQSGTALGIEGGRLAAAGPGVMKIRSEAVKKALAQGGAEVALMLDALEDFHYETLTLEIDKTFGGEGRVLLRTRGHNPAVRNGQLFVINLNVSGNVDHLAAVAAEALQLPAAIVRSMLPKAP